ncbi:hypothetical protein V8U11_08160 [Pseudomonas chlororaphis]|uniref:hypothetical protein n=1 Tax=Pseudomonas chlororaphis TaxID=587753 RepID=UPI0030D50977
MANIYYDATGVLILDRVTPVITALFGGFMLDANYPGNGQAYIARIAEDNSPSWDCVLDGLLDLAAQLDLPAPDMGDAGDGGDADPDREPLINVILDLIADHFGAGENEELANLIERHGFENDADLEALFLIATCFNDGHNLTAIQFEGCWRCSKPRLFEFGGDGRFLSREVRVYSTSPTALQLGDGLRNAIVAGDFNATAALIEQQTQALIAGIQDKHIRMLVVQRVASRLLASLSVPGAT